jgi:murein DD-endopeptidase MepM/ murein hydrolase activator NlpD
MPPRPLVFIPAIIALILLGFLRAPSAADGKFFPIDRARDLPYFPVPAGSAGQIVPTKTPRFLPIARTEVAAVGGLPLRRTPAKRQIGTGGGVPPVVVRSHRASIGVAAVISVPTPAPIIKAAIHTTDTVALTTPEMPIPPSPGSGHYVWPIDLAAHSRVTSTFGWRSDPFSGKPAFHGALDIAAAEGSTVVATSHGVVHAVGEHARLGRYVMLSLRDGSMATYGHLKDYIVGTGQLVRRGQPIGHVGSTGRSTGPHVDFRLEIDGRRIDPLPLLRGAAKLAAR